MSQVPPQGPERLQPVRCWHCQNLFYIPPEAVGRTVHCTICGQPNVTTMPAGMTPPPAPGVPTWGTVHPMPVTRRTKSPGLAAFLNFFFWGLGYIYAGRTWGWFIFVPWLLLTLLALGAQAEAAEAGGGEPSPVVFTAVIINLAISIALAWHAYTMVANDNMTYPR